MEETAIVHRIIHLCATAAVGLVASIDSGEARAAPPRRAAGESGVEVLTRGPVHESFAETVTFDPEPGILAPIAPPEPIDELPPDRRPEGFDIAWIPGYWAWDDERKDFLWASGVWRALPPGRQWAPGYWGASGKRFQWTSGYWADAAASEVEYLPKPPESVETGPNGVAPSADHDWLPGHWVWRDHRYYAWRSGHWANVQPDWVWVPAHYVWAPCGYVFVDGYWDYPIGQRGVLFAPVYFAAKAYARPGFHFSPAMAIDSAVFGMHLFLRPQYGHYYFGDYYADNYATAGFCSWFSFHNDRGYEPIYAYDRWRNRADVSWEQSVKSAFRNFRDHKDARPPRTWAAQSAHATDQSPSERRRYLVAAPLEDLAGDPDGPLRFQTVDAAERRIHGERGQEVHRWRAQRQTREVQAAARANAKPEGSHPTLVELPRSPIVARPADGANRRQVPPNVPANPVPVRTTKPKPGTRPGKPETPQG